MSPLLAAGVGVHPGIGAGNGPLSQPDMLPVASPLAVGSPLDSPGSVVVVDSSVVVVLDVLDPLAELLAVALVLTEPALELSLPPVVPIVSTSEGPT